MSNFQDLSYFNLHGIDRCIGFEKRRSSEVSGIVVIILVVNPAEGLKLLQPMEFSLRVPVKYHIEGEISVRTSDPSAAVHIERENLKKVGEEYEVLLPAGMTRVKYPFPVWLFAIRALLAAPKTVEWSTATMLSSEFKHLTADWPMHAPSPAQQLRLFHGAGRTRGKRNYMEDVDFVFESININSKCSISVFGVMDGHGGKECAQYCSEDIPVRIATHLRSGATCPDALYQAFRESDLECLETQACGNSGSTANLAMYDTSTNLFYIANTGDTRAVLSRHGKALDLSYDRKGNDPEEIARVVKAGGFVSKGRIMGSLAVSRALGDRQLKEQGAQALKRVLIPDPELSCFYPTRFDDFLLIATDGLWDVMTSQAAVDYAKGLLLKESLLENEAVEQIGTETISARLAQVAHNLAMHAVSVLNSADNVTVLIVLLRGGPAACPLDLPSLSARVSYAVTSGSGSSCSNNISSVSSARSSGDDFWGNSNPKLMQTSIGAYYSPEDDGSTVEVDPSNQIDTLSLASARFSSSKPMDSSIGIINNFSSKSNNIASTYNGSGGASMKAVAKAGAGKYIDDDDDADMMQFLIDDTNF